MWISRKKWNEMQNKIADLEEQVQSQQKILIKHMDDHERENKELINILQGVKNEIYKGMQQTL